MWERGKEKGGKWGKNGVGIGEKGEKVGKMGGKGKRGKGEKGEKEGWERGGKEWEKRGMRGGKGGEKGVGNGEKRVGKGEGKSVGKGKCERPQSGAGSRLGFGVAFAWFDPKRGSGTAPKRCGDNPG